jgi:hypothetical protein
VEFPILGNGVKDFDGTLRIVQKLVEFGLNHQPPRFWTGGLLFNLWQSAARLENPNPAFMTLMDRVTSAVQDNPTAWLQQAQRSRAVPLISDTRASNMGNHLGAYYVFTKRVEVPELVQKYLDCAMKANDNEYLENYIQELIGLFEMGYLKITVAALKPLISYKSESVHQTIINFLVRARNYDPEYIEDLLLRGDFPQEIADRVLANPTVERLTDLLTWQLATIIYDLFVLGPKPLRNELKWFYAKAMDLPSFQDLIILIIREILNIVIGEVVFNVPADAPSRQYEKEVDAT